MPSSDYTGIGGGLKLKGAKSAGVDKKRKKKKPSSSEDAQPAKANSDELAKDDDGAVDASGQQESSSRKAEDNAPEGHGAYKTEAERRHEERRRKRLDERVKREGVKTHKEKVEELNKYLSNLSEHHDMPRIGPG